MTRQFTSVIAAVLLVFVAEKSIAQSGPITADEAREARLDSDRFKNGYKTSVPGWTIKIGDTLYFGKASMPTKQFGFIYETPSTYVNGRLVYRYMPSDYAGKRGIVKDLIQNGTKRQGFKMCAEIGVGLLVRYYAEIDNAVEAGEMLPPPRLRTAATTVQATTGSVADELLKLKQLMDAGALTKEEYEAQKKKLLNK
ncbi:hypothetical protein GCM10028807_02890 [Spirosoma daeguense]